MAIKVEGEPCYRPDAEVVHLPGIRGEEGCRLKKQPGILKGKGVCLSADGHYHTIAVILEFANAPVESGAKSDKKPGSFLIG